MAPNALKSFANASSQNWVDNVAVQYWLSDRDEWSTFVRNLVKKVKELSSATWSNMYPRGSSDQGGL